MTESDAGYAVYDHVFERKAMVQIVEALAAPDVARTKAGARHVLNVPAVRALASDPRLLAIANGFVGSSAVPFRATLFDKSPTSNWLVAWHQDTALPLRNRVDDADWGPWSLKGSVLYAHAPAWALERVVALRVHLDDSIESNGPLRVLPDTHARGVLSNEEIERLARELPLVVCLAPSGGVVAMRPLAVHASSKARDENPRRVVHIEYAATLNLGPDIDLAVS